MIRIGSILTVLVFLLTSGGCGAPPVPATTVIAPKPLPRKIVFTRRKGTIHPKKVSSAMGSRLDVFKNCYEALLVRMPNRQVDLLLGFTIETDGRTSRGRVIRSTGMDLAMNHCVLDVLAETQFSEPEGGHVEVTFPLQFKPQ